MDELEFCVKSLSYPLGMLLEGMEREESDAVVVRRGKISVPRVHFATRCYLVARSLYEALDEVDRKRLCDDRIYMEDFILSILTSPLGREIGPELGKTPIRVEETLAIDWLEFENRADGVRPLLKEISLGNKPGEIARLSVDECLLLSYLAGDRKSRERVNALLGKYNPTFREAVKAYFRALKR